MYKCSHACTKTECTSLIKYNKKVNTAGSHNNAMENKWDATSYRFQYYGTHINKIIFCETVVVCSQSKFFPS